MQHKNIERISGKSIENCDVAFSNYSDFPVFQLSMLLKVKVASYQPTIAWVLWIRGHSLNYRLIDSSNKYMLHIQLCWKTNLENNC